MAEIAGELGIELLQTADVNDSDSRAAIASTGSTAAAVCAFGQIIREPLLEQLQMLNVHPSLLPRWRGAAPIERTIMAGDTRSGVCIIELEAGLDSGPVAVSEATDIGAGEDFGSLSARLAELGGELLVRAFDQRAAGRLELDPQAADGVTYAGKIEPTDRRVRIGDPVADSVQRVRALTPHIGAFVALAGGERLGLRSAEALEPSSAEPIGAAAADPESGRLLISCIDGTLAVAEVQPQGKRWMAAADYLRGRPLPEPAP